MKLLVPSAPLGPPSGFRTDIIDPPLICGKGELRAGQILFRIKSARRAFPPRAIVPSARLASYLFIYIYITRTCNDPPLTFYSCLILFARIIGFTDGMGKTIP